MESWSLLTSKLSLGLRIWTQSALAKFKNNTRGRCTRQPIRSTGGCNSLRDRHLFYELDQDWLEIIFQHISTIVLLSLNMNFTRFSMTAGIGIFLESMGSSSISYINYIKINLLYWLICTEGTNKRVMLSRVH